MSMYSTPEQQHRPPDAGFTLIELLVVISIIGLLSSIVMVSLNTARSKANNAARQENMHSIITALQMYYIDYGCLPTTSGTTCGPASGTYNQADMGGYDFSSQGGGFMTFLKTAGSMSNVPVDPVNNMTGQNSPASTYSFRYYCYTGALNGVSLGYWDETVPVWDGGYTSVLPYTGHGVLIDTSYFCK